MTKRTTYTAQPISKAQSALFDVLRDATAHHGEKLGIDPLEALEVLVALFTTWAVRLGVPEGALLHTVTLVYRDVKAAEERN